MTPLPTAILVDMDDTIVTYSEGTGQRWLDLCHRYAPQLPGVSVEALLAATGRSRDWFWSDVDRHRRGRLDLLAARTEIIALALAELGLRAPEVAAEMAATYESERDGGMHPFPGALEALQAMRDRGIRLALLTNGASAPQRRKIERFGLAPYFGCIIVEGEFGCGKPDERVYRHALEQLRARPQETWMVGDNLVWDVGAPQALGITGVWLDYAGTGLPADATIRPDRIVTSLAELARIIATRP
ncbi:MAG: HAD family hydrolase [Anaerolineae bacterium]